MINSAGILAAGEGSRLKLSGLEVHKPLVPIAGFPLIGHTLRQILNAGIRRAVIIFNEAEQECADWVRTHFPELAFEILVKSTKSSFESFWRVGRALGPGRHLICTVDSICSPADWRKMITSTAGSAHEILLGVTSFVHDEKPLWVGTDPGSLRIVEIGGSVGKYATAGFYNVSDAIFDRELKDDISSLRVFLKELLHEGFPTRAIPLADVIDVDTAEDIDLAERFLSEIRSGV
ncbi:MAG: NTP transferase domain-containing protein [Terrimicrobiaceae bacterium]